ncbi:hypothetical protein O7635_12460 [Asanoa sp. WMMD1127]|uniref:PepSY domain-containing protein n=1 Tax=Asanoa sp. WMMD1127 TaxID=3016107 RepID=UPI002416819D|nr:PepSY domain-containing protein [Asanoa sp. WMMD1127]MDG4822663.1 hypothetical protein [Asanoa sp. WMMD1127]
MKRTPVIITLAGMAALAVTGTALAVGAAAEDDAPVALTGLGSAIATADPSASPTDEPSGTPSASPSGSATATTPPVSGGIDTAAAARIALDRVGGGTVTEVESEQEHGVSTWQVEVERDGVEHDVYVDRANGGIVKADSEADDDDDDDDDDRDDDDDDRDGDDD